MLDMLWLPTCSGLHIAYKASNAIVVRGPILTKLLFTIKILIERVGTNSFEISLFAQCYKVKFVQKRTLFHYLSLVFLVYFMQVPGFFKS